MENRIMAIALPQPATRQLRVRRARCPDGNAAVLLRFRLWQD
ncbi:hypothetical protein AD47_5228 [Escherichia coli 6-319-05_S4_C3]|nr:hypothetical protein AD47_5228 [Escherichia coli 6-319-05_S4_C3]